MANKVYEIITQKIIEKLEQGTIPWKKPFRSAQAVNWETQKPYRGINTLLLEPGEYATFRNIQKHGGKVKKGEQAQIAVLWKWVEKKTDEHEEDGEKEAEKYPLLRYYRVFEINSQVEGLESNRKVEAFDHDPVTEAETIISSYSNPPKITHAPGGAWYKPGADQVNVPEKSEFADVNKYYSTFFHELVHSTGHERRLKREGIANMSFFGSMTYSKEELVAEIGASFLCGIAGIDNTTIDNSASYIQGWLKVLKGDPKMIVHASQQAQKAADWIVGKKKEGGLLK